jgi:hypothetical protein
MKRRGSGDLRDQFRTLDDPMPDVTLPAGPYPSFERDREPVGCWRADPAKPGLWRRFWAWALLGYRWRD